MKDLERYQSFMVKMFYSDAREIIEVIKATVKHDLKNVEENRDLFYELDEDTRVNVRIDCYVLGQVLSYLEKFDVPMSLRDPDFEKEANNWSQLVE